MGPSENDFGMAECSLHSKICSALITMDKTNNQMLKFPKCEDLDHWGLEYKPSG